MKTRVILQPYCTKSQCPVSCKSVGGLRFYLDPVDDEQEYITLPTYIGVGHVACENDVAIVEKVLFRSDSLSFKQFFDDTIDQLYKYGFIYAGYIRHKKDGTGIKYTYLTASKTLIAKERL